MSETPADPGTPPTAPRDSDLAQALRALMRRYGVPAVMAEAARLAQQRI